VKRLHFLIPGDLETRTGGYGYDRRMIAGLRDRGWRVDVVRLDDSFPVPAREARAHAAQALGGIPDEAIVLIDGLALGAMPEEAERAALHLKMVGLVHHPLAAETGIASELAEALEASERRALAAVRRVVVTSRATAARLAAYGVSSDRIAVVEPGTDPAPLARGTTQPAAVSLLCVATLTPRKGYELLIGALAAIQHRSWTLTCAGSLDRDAGTVSRVRAALRQHGLEDRVSLVGDLDTAALAQHYDRADLFVLPTLYEGFGMAVAEALARGLPVVGTDTGAIGDLVGDHAGIVVPPGDLAGLTAALSRAIGDAGLRARLAHGARQVRERLPTWAAAAAGMERVLEAVAES
jgi:glycosyltransferase involved in cell wall biosynthesis